jgi:hypothetical protein
VKSFTETVVEQAALAWLESTGWQVATAPTSRLTCPRAPCLRRGVVGGCASEWPASELAINRRRPLRSADTDFGVQPT